MNDLLDTPPTRPKPKSETPRTVLLWILLILMLVSFYQLSTVPSPHAHHGGGEIDWLPTALLGGVAAAVIGVIFYLCRITTRFKRQNTEGMVLLRKGAYDQAAEAFEAILRRPPRLRRLRGVARHNAGTARLLQGQLERAIELLMVVVDDSSVPSLKASAASQLASACALAGRLDEAEAWLVKVEAVPNVSPSALAMPRALLMARRGAFAELARMLEASWRELEGTLTGMKMRRMLLLRAFAVASAEGPRGAGAAEPLIAQLRAAGVAEHRWLAARWPELGAFLATNQL